MGGSYPDDVSQASFDRAHDEWDYEQEPEPDDEERNDTMKFYGPHLMDGITPTCTLCKNRIPPALSASGCEKNALDLDELFSQLQRIAIAQENIAELKLRETGVRS